MSGIVELSKEFKELFKIINSPVKEILKEFPMPFDKDLIYYIKVNKWYHNFWNKLQLKWLKFIYGFKYSCLCDCHFRHGYYHCWGADCCKEPNKQYRKKFNV